MTLGRKDPQACNSSKFMATQWLLDSLISNGLILNSNWCMDFDIMLSCLLQITIATNYRGRTSDKPKSVY